MKHKDEVLITDGLGKTVFLEGFARNRRGKDANKTLDNCTKCHRLIRDDNQCPFCGTHQSMR